MSTTRRFLASAVGAIVLYVPIALADQGPSAPATTACTVASLQAVAPAGTVITEAARVSVEGSLPAYCRVDGHAASPGNTVNFRLGLPDAWNGKFYFTGVGGLGGSIGSLNAGLTRGYASASTDTGHQSSDPTWGSNRAKEIDYGHRGTHVTAVAAKALTASFYNRSPAHAYFNGCSNGGRQALMEVQRYPEDFDGIIAGHPATGTPMQLGRALAYQQLLASEANYVPAAKIELLDRATLAACDAADGLTDGLVSDPRKCTFRPETLQCKGADGPDCLTAGQVESVRRLYAGIRAADGTWVSYGFPVGHEGGRTGWTQWIVGATPPVRQADGTLAYNTSGEPSGFRLARQNFEFLALDRDEPGFGWRTVKYPEDLPRLRVMSEILSPTDPDLRPFKNRGGKIIMYHGWADPGISAYGTLDYYEKVVAAVGGQRQADEFARLYLAPGVHHCGGGPGPGAFDILSALEAWVERGVAPGAIVTSREESGKVTRTRPLCPHPQVARYVGKGSVDDAANFTCAAP
jgi:feruloyl esterase